MIAIGGGGYVPARILRSFLKQPGSANIPIQAIGLSLYESLGTDTQIEEPGTKVTRTQWLDLGSLEMANLIGKNVLIVDEVDDTRTTLEYAVRELEKDVAAAAQESGREGEATKFSVFVLHNKDKAKKGSLPKEMVEEGRYLAAVTVGDVWINYPWEATYVRLYSIGCADANSMTGILTSMIVWQLSKVLSRHSSLGRHRQASGGQITDDMIQQAQIGNALFMTSRVTESMHTIIPLQKDQSHPTPRQPTSHSPVSTALPSDAKSPD